MAEPEIPEGPKSWQGIGEEIYQGILDGLIKSDSSKAAAAWLADVIGKVLAVAVASTSPVGIGLAKGIAASEDLVAPALADIAATAVSDAFGIKVNPSAFRSRRDPSGRKGAADALGAGFLQAVEGAGGAVEPNDEAAKRFLGMVMNMALEGWYQGWFFEFMSSLVPYFDVGKIESFAELDDTIMQALGVGRMTRRVVQPLLQARVITPLQWRVNKQYRPELLSVADAVRQYHRGRWSLEQLTEELARQGWSAERIEALINAGRKFFSAGDVRMFVDRNHWTNDRGLQHLADQGYTQAEAEDVLRLEGLRRIDQLEVQEANAIVTAYVNREISGSEFRSLLRTAVQSATERALYEELGEIRRGVNVRFLSSTDERRLVFAGIRSVVDFRHALEREGLVPDGIAALELELRAELADRRADEELREEQRRDREAEKQRQAEERAARLAAIAAEQALPSVAEVRRAYVRGHVPIDRYSRAVQDAHPGIAGDDVAALLADAEQDRAAQLEALERRKAAELQEADAVVPLGDVRQAVLRRVLTLEDFDRELVDRGFDEAERRVLVAVLRDELEDRAAAAKERDEARRRAAARGVSLDAWERAVRLHVRTLEQYSAYLSSIETPELARALLLDVLAAQLAQDDQARAKREALEAAARPRGISLERRRRAVLLGIRDLAYYERALVDAQLPVDDQRVELALVEAERADVAAARARRDEIARELDERQRREEAERAARAAELPPTPPPTELTLGQVERAVKLGLLPPDALRTHALEKGYDPADAELLVELAIFQVPDLRAGARRRDEIKSELAARRVSLDELERAVLRGIRDLSWFEGELAGRGYGEDDVGLLAQLLSERAALEIDTLRRKIRAALEKADGAPALDVLEGALVSGTIGADDAQATLEGAGVTRDTALVYVRLLLTGGVEQ